VHVDQLAQVLDRARRRRPAQQVQVAAVAPDPLDRGLQPRAGREVGRLVAGARPAADHLRADVLDLDRPGGWLGVGEVRQRRFHRDEAVEHVRIVVLEVDVQDVRLTRGGDVARHLEGHGRLAGALRAADEHQLAGSQAATEHPVQRGEAQRHGLVVREVACRHLRADIGQHLQRRARSHRAVAGIERPLIGPCRCGGRSPGFLAAVHAVVPPIRAP
jgi:hypothetical protein